MELRKKVVLGVIFDNEENVLLMKRASDEKTNPNMWGFIGGGVEIGETLSEALNREIKEEGGLDLKGFTFVRKYNYDSVEINIMTKFLDEYKPELTLNHEHDDYGWFAEGELPSPHFSETVENIRQSKSNLKSVIFEIENIKKLMIKENSRSTLF